jgi:polyisoprenoid-binding protein YceI
MTFATSQDKYNISPLGAAGLVNEAWDYYRELGAEWLNMTTTAIASLDSVHIDPISFSVNFNLDNFVQQFVRPTKPTRPTFATVAPQDVPAPELDDIHIRVLGDAPEEPAALSQVAYNVPPAPTTPLPTAPPNTTPVLVDIDVPTRPAMPLPVVPTLLELVGVEVEPIVLPTFQGVRPTFDIAMPDDGTLAWQEVYYTSALKDELTAKIRDMLQGSLGLPPVIEQAIFDRGRAREERLSRKLVQEIHEDMDSRGMSEPNGITGQRLQDARIANREKVGDLNQNITIESAKLSIDNVKFAIGQGMALEQVLIQTNQSINERALRAALATRDYGLARVNVLIGYANLQQQAYATDAQVFRDLIAAELSKLEKTKLELDAQRLRGEINKDLIAQYVAQFEAIKAMADIYRSDVEAAKAKGEINVQRISAAKLIVEKFGIEVDAWGKQQDGYKNQVEAALGTVRFAEVLAGIFGTRLNAYKVKGDAYFQEGRFALDRNAQTIARFQAALSGADQNLRGQLATLDGQLRAYAADVTAYEVDGTIASAESAALDRTTSLKIEAEKSRTSVALEQARIRIEQALKIGEILVEQIKAKAQILGQLVSSSQSGVNFGANLSGSVGVSYGYGRNYSYSADTDDSPAPGF